MTTFIQAVLNDNLFRSYFFYNGILVVKMCSMSTLTAFQRIKNKTFANPEDAKVLPGAKVQSNDNVERVRRAHLNDLENIPIYFVASFAYLCTNPAPATAMMLMRTFTASRILHTLVYAVYPMPQPTRGIVWGVGFGIIGYMAVVSIMHFM